MSNNLISSINNSNTPQCQFFVVRKKRLCRMTVRPGRQYCGEHEPKPKTEEGKHDTRIPCPYDPKHTCYASKLEKHLSICNARQMKLPEYIERNINAPSVLDSCVRKPLSEIPRETLVEVIEKVNLLYEKHIAGNISEAPQRPIHAAVEAEFQEANRTESSRRHLRQASSLLHIAEEAGLVRDRTCYVELGAGKGQLCYYMGVWWCSEASDSSVVAIDRAALRHKRDTKLGRARAAAVTEGEGVARHRRVRADLADVRLGALPEVRASGAAVAFAKHLCGDATDLALRCITEEGVVRACVLATCCHHRAGASYVAAPLLQELGISGDELNVILGVVSWATCGDGRSRARGAARRLDTDYSRNDNGDMTISEQIAQDTYQENGFKNDQTGYENTEENQYFVGGSPRRAEVGRRAKALLDWGRVLFLRGKGFDARLCHYVPASVSLENVCLVATKRDR